MYLVYKLSLTITKSKGLLMTIWLDFVGEASISEQSFVYTGEYYIL